MSSSIPFIRAAVIAPMLCWLREHERDPAPLLERADLAWLPLDDPLFPMPLRPGIRFLVEIARAEGPDAPCRIANGHSGFNIGLPGAAAFSGTTLLDGLHRMVRAMPMHCTHEIFTVSDGPGGIHFRDGWTTDIGDGEARHLVQQYVAALMEMICRTIAAPRPCMASIAMVPHPVAGLDHLRRWFGDRLAVAAGANLDIVITSEAAASPVPAGIRETALRELTASPHTVLRQGPSIADDVVMLVTAMLARTTPSLARAAVAAGVSPRTLRRRLAQEGHSFTELVEQARARIALRRLRDGPAPALNELAREVGYANQATLSRAVRRWTGSTPSDLRTSGHS